MSGFPVQSAKLIHLIETTETHGDGTKTDPVRTAKSYWTLDGELLFQRDPYLGDIVSASSKVNSESM